VEFANQASAIGFEKYLKRAFGRAFAIRIAIQLRLDRDDVIPPVTTRAATQLDAQSAATSDRFHLGRISLLLSTRGADGWIRFRR
jgi:hypothetical protein